MNPIKLFEQCIKTLVQRGEQRDSPEGERSVGAVVEVFNTLTGHTLTESQGAIFLAIVKLVRMQRGDYDPDNYIDCINYMALANEAAAKSAKESS